jgi:hypothetical protein
MALNHKGFSTRNKELCVEENIWAKEGWNDGRVEKAAQRGAS